MVRFFRRKEETAAGAPEAIEAAEPLASVAHAVERTRRTWFSRIGGLFKRSSLDEQLWEELEETLIAADTGVETTLKLLEGLKERVRREDIRDPQEAQEALKEELVAILEVDDSKGKLWGSPGGSPFDRLKTSGTVSKPVLSEVEGPAVILVIGVNGSGKTTSIGKLAHAYRAQGRRVVLAAADTFRAAAIEQLQQWGQRVGADVIAHRTGADPGAVVFDALIAAEKRDADVVIVDTAGRLHTKVNLMEEMRKVNRVIQRKFPEAPHEVLLVLDATTGQNALQQAKYFTEAVGVSAILLAKLDGTAKGGIIFAVCEQLGIPVRFIGTGERSEGLAPFDPQEFVAALLL
jgi:fused signal recognition particle receptor